MTRRALKVCRQSASFLHRGRHNQETKVSLAAALNKRKSCFPKIEHFTLDFLRSVPPKNQAEFLHT